MKQTSALTITINFFFSTKVSIQEIVKKAWQKNKKIDIKLQNSLKFYLSHASSILLITKKFRTINWEEFAREWQNCQNQIKRQSMIARFAYWQYVEFYL